MNMITSGNWYVTAVKPEEKCIYVSMEGRDKLVITDLTGNKASLVSRSFSCGTFVANTFKYRSEILRHMMNAINIHDDASPKFVELSALEKIDEICEANRRLF